MKDNYYIITCYNQIEENMIENKKKKYTFILKNLDIKSIARKYDFEVDDEIDGECVTRLDDLIQEGEPEYSFLDETRTPKKCSVTMKDSLRGMELQVGINCFWCKNSFNTKPIGCPIDYIPSQVVKRYFSEITKDYYTIKENITQKNVDIDKVRSEKCVIDVIENDYYVTDGVFCSFNCCYSWIKDNNHKYMYNMSEQLLQQIYYKIFGNISKIQPAPSWRLLKEYGGHMDITTFRNSYNNTIYKESMIIKSLLKTKPIGFVYEEYIKI